MKESFKGSAARQNGGGIMVDQIGGCKKGFSPKGERDFRIMKLGVNGIQKMMMFAFSNSFVRG